MPNALTIVVPLLALIGIALAGKVGFDEQATDLRAKPRHDFSAAAMGRALGVAKNFEPGKTFLTGVHATLRAGRLATTDDGFFREHFRRVLVVPPGPSR